MGTDCKSAAFQLRWFESTRAHQKASTYASTLRFLLCNKAKLIGRVDSNSCGAVAEDSVKTAQWAVFSSAACVIHPRPPKCSAYENTLGFLFYKKLKFHFLGWIRTAAEPTAACGGNREARLGQRSDFSSPRQGVAEKSASATRKARRFASRRAKTAAARKAPCGGCSHFVESSGKITSRTRRCTRSRTLPAAS